MALIQDLIKQINDPILRDRLLTEVDKLSKQKKFGLVFEEHLPECTPLYDMPIKRGSKVALKAGKVNDFYNAISIEGENVFCADKEGKELIKFLKNDVVPVVEFGEPIYPYLQKIDSIYNSDDAELPTHALIQADNYHALQLLEYLYAGKVDCIYIDPPYNTGARDWKYNNDYVDSADTYRHSKWLSMMKKRLLLAKKLLNPTDSVMIVTIDEKEYLHLGCLLEDLFPESNIQMISSLIAQKGVARNSSFYRVNEFIYFIQFGKSYVQPLDLDEQWTLGKNDSAAAKGIVWSQLRRSGTNDLRTDRPNLFYPIIFNKAGTKIISVGKPLDSKEHPSSALEKKDNELWLWPIKEDGTEGNWQLSNTEVCERLSKGYIKIGKLKENTIPLSYLKRGSILKIENEEVKLLGYDENSGTVIVDATDYSREFVPGSQWDIETHDATYHGAQLLNKIIGKRFSFPKSLYAVHDAIRFFVANKPNALIIDFFAGSGTTLHAVNLLNAEDGGKRQCIMVTNNEVSDDEAKTLTAKGFTPGDAEWENLGIARYITWPRTVCSIEGHDINGEILDGEYITSKTVKQETMRSVTQIKFIDDVSLLKIGDKKQLVTLISDGVLPQNLVDSNTKYIVSDDLDHTVSILFDETAADEYIEALDGMQHITEFYIVTKNAKIFRNIKEQINEILGNIIVDVPVKMPMADGFKANAVFFKLGFLDKTSVQLGRQFKEMLPMLWLKAGGWGKCPTAEVVSTSSTTANSLPPYIVLPENRFAVLIDENYFSEFAEKVHEKPEIQTAYLITDFEKGFKAMTNSLKIAKTYQLYRDYLDNFRINVER
ncbi:site-specific DNA-methyltransferase [bacterium]|nr:site-specific DNA-methyltransferase [bacterium]